MGKQEEEYKFRIKWYQRLRHRNLLIIIVLALAVYSVSQWGGFSGMDPLTGQFVNTPIERVYVPFGGNYHLKINLTNIHNDTANATLQLDPKGDNYMARFVNHPLAQISSNRRVLNTSGYPLSPGEERIFEVEITSISFDDNDGNLTIIADIVECFTCNTIINVSVNTQHPIDFPGIEIPAIIFMFSLAGLIYWKNIED